MYIQKLSFTRSNISGYASVYNAGQTSEQHAVKTEEQLEVLRLQLFLKYGRGVTQNTGWKQKPLSVSAISLIYTFLCFIHPSYPQQGTRVLAGYVECHPVQDGEKQQSRLPDSVCIPEGSPRGHVPIQGSVHLGILSKTTARHRNRFPDTRLGWPASHPVSGASFWMDLDARSVFPLRNPRQGTGASL